MDSQAVCTTIRISVPTEMAKRSWQAHLDHHLALRFGDRLLSSQDHLDSWAAPCSAECRAFSKLGLGLTPMLHARRIEQSVL